MLLPRSVKVYGIRYKIVLVQKLEGMRPSGYRGKKEMVGLEGMIDYSGRSIYIDNNRCFEEKVHTLFHELIHAIEYHGFLGQLFDRHKNRELIIDQVALALITLLRDNPKLRALWATRPLKKKSPKT